MNGQLKELIGREQRDIIDLGRLGIFTFRVGEWSNIATLINFQMFFN
jgi:hypothetical protein